MAEVKPAIGLTSGAFLALRRHPESEGGEAIVVEAEAVRERSGRLTLRYRFTGEIEALLLPAHTASSRRDGLWEHSCLEAFVRSGSEDYCEINLAPSTQWAAYRFAGYRQGRSDAPMPAPRIDLRAHADSFTLEAEVEMRDLPADRTWRVGLSAILEAKDGRKSWWALAHPPGNPDFHHDDCFALILPPVA